MSSLFAAASWPFGIAAGTAVGAAVAGGIQPGVQELINEANRTYPLKPPAYFVLATGVGEGKVDRGWATDRAAEQGISGDAFGRLVDIAEKGPGVALAFELWRRGLIDDGGFGRAVKREGVEDEWLNPLRALKQRLLSPAELANARQQEFIADGRLESEGALQGYDAERMQLMYKMAGLPPGVMDALTMLRRGIIDETTYAEIVAEGHTKTKYTADLLALRQHVLTETDAAGLWLRGWITQAEAEAIGALNGYDATAMQHLYENRGRPATTHQVHIGYARGGRLPGVGDDEQATMRRSVEESDIRVEWFDILWASRYTMPSAFVLRALTQDGTFTEAQAENILLESGWRPDLAKDAATKWSGGVAGPSTKWADRAKSSTFTSAHRDYLAGDGDEEDVRPLLTAVGATGAEQDSIIALWNLERTRVRRGLTQAQILKLYKKTVWTRDQALAGLDDLGMEADDANALLDAL